MGGDLARSKCSFGALTYNYTPTRYGDASVTLFSGAGNPGKIELQSFCQSEPLTTLRRLDPDTAERYLGLHLTLNCTWKFEFKKRNTQFGEMAQRIDDSAMTRLDAYCFNCHMPRAVIFGPKLYGESSLAGANVEQAISLITDMITDIQ